MAIPSFSSQEVEEEQQQSQQKHEFRHGSGLHRHILRSSSSKFYAK
jgi:hypothetical protein